MGATIHRVRATQLELQRALTVFFVAEAGASFPAITSCRYVATSTRVPAA